MRTARFQNVHEPFFKVHLFYGLDYHFQMILTSGVAHVNFRKVAQGFGWTKVTLEILRLSMSDRPGRGSEKMIVRLEFIVFRCRTHITQAIGELMSTDLQNLIGLMEAFRLLHLFLAWHCRKCA